MKFVYSDGGRNRYFKVNNVNDCVIRAICNATQKDYLEAYNDLKKLNGDKSCRNGTPLKVAKKYINSLKGWEWVPTMLVGQGCKVHLKKR